MISPAGLFIGAMISPAGLFVGLLLLALVFILNWVFYKGKIK